MKIPPDSFYLAETPCIDGGSESDGTLTEATLKSLINSVYPVFDDAPATLKTFFGTTDYGKNLVENGRSLRVLQSDKAISKTRIWLSFPPFINSSENLNKTYKDMKLKPTIEILGTFPVAEVNETVEQFKCLANLKSHGFNFVPWNIRDFKRHMDRENCKARLSDAEASPGFAEQMRVLKKLLDHVNELSENPNVSKWCPESSPTLAKMQCMN